ncbi:hypothetical protein [Allobaculum sp. JKK-2023]|uniref:hypothetical protein n=1 Tax=Allobaculum sp. JKK-2023 TaxID=3108943 RepID=UPI002B054DFE|nr:hypothetical protein [Allobaculum sp. JKK-2023]
MKHLLTTRMLIRSRKHLRLCLAFALIPLYAAGCSTSNIVNSPDQSEKQSEESQLNQVHDAKDPSESSQIDDVPENSNQNSNTSSAFLYSQVSQTYNFGSYVLREGENIDPLRGENGNFYFQTVAPLKGLMTAPTRALYKLNCETGDIAELSTFDDEENIRICDVMEFQGVQLQLIYRFNDAYIEFIILKDGQEIYNSLAVDTLNLPKLTQVQDNLYFSISEMDITNSVFGNVYRIGPDFSIEQVYTSAGYIVGLINTVNYSGNFGIGIHQESNKRFGFLDNQDQLTFVEVPNDDYIYPLSDGFMHLKPISEKVYSISWIDKETQEEIDLDQTFEGVMGNYTALENNVFMFEDLNQQSYIGCFDGGQIKIEPVESISSGLCRYAQISSNSLFVYIHQNDVNENGQTVSKDWSGALLQP